jgi:hypothetical protein
MFILLFIVNWRRIFMKNDCIWYLSKVSVNELINSIVDTYQEYLCLSLRQENEWFELHAIVDFGKGNELLQKIRLFLVGECVFLKA